MKKSRVGITLSLLVLINGAAVLADDQTGITNYPQNTQPAPQPSVTGTGGTSAAPAPAPATQTAPSGTTEGWPWMNQEKSKGDTSGASTSAPSTSGANTSAPPEKKGVVTATAAPKAEQQKASSQPMKLYGRIEEIAGTNGASFPIHLKAMTPKLDTRKVPPLTASANQFSGKLVSSFPTDYRGTWGGNMLLQQCQVSPTYYSIDPEEARRTAQAMRVGTTGATNFSFDNVGAKIALEPAQVMFMVPGKDTMAADQVGQMLGPQSGAMSGMISQMVQNMPVPVILHFGEINTAGSSMGETGLSGNQMRAIVLRNDIRQLAPGVLEQQVVTQETTTNKQTGRPRVGYGETVIRFTSRNPQQMYVQAASVNYDSSKHFLDKVVLAGWITRGQVMQTNPYGSIMDMQRMMGSPGGGRGMPAGMPAGMPQIPGFSPDMLKQIMGQ